MCIVLQSYCIWTSYIDVLIFYLNWIHNHVISGSSPTTNKLLWLNIEQGSMDKGIHEMLQKNISALHAQYPEQPEPPVCFIAF